MPNSITLLRKKKVDKAYWRGSQIDILLGLYLIKNKRSRGNSRFVMFGEPNIHAHYEFDQIVQNTHIYFNFNNGLGCSRVSGLSLFPSPAHNINAVLIFIF